MMKDGTLIRIITNEHDEFTGLVGNSYYVKKYKDCNQDIKCLNCKDQNRYYLYVDINMNNQERSGNDQQDGTWCLKYYKIKIINKLKKEDEVNIFDVI